MSIANILPKLAFILFLAAVVAIFGRAQSGSDEQAAGDSRQVWFNRNYNLLLKQVSDTEWHEIEIKTGKIWTKLSFVTSTPDYVELWIIPRNAPKRLFKDHSEDLEKGKWVTTASGEWKNGPPTPRPDAPTDERADVDNDDKAKEWSSA